MERIESHGCAGGRQEVWRHASEVLGCEMKFGVYLPPQAVQGQICPAVYWLSGLTCTEQNFITKAGAQAHAAALGLVLVVPDTSPRGPGIADDPAYDLGQGAGFYVNATQSPWAPHYRMQDYVAEELPALMAEHFGMSGASGIMGHSMGGHGALVTALRHPGRYRSVSALAPIVTPTQVPWGRKALAAYLGPDESAWAAWDAVSLIRAQPPTAERLPLLVDQGNDDEFLAQLRPELLEQACRDAGHPLTLRRHAGYDHSYYFIASFIGEHLAHHAKALT